MYAKQADRLVFKMTGVSANDKRQPVHTGEVGVAVNPGLRNDPYCSSKKKDKDE